MAKCAMMSDFLISLPDHPGELARLAKILREAEVNLVGLWGYGRGEGKARLYCVPQNAEEFRKFAESAGLDVNEGKTFYITGVDHPGALLDSLDQIAAAGINLHAIEVVQIGGEFGGFVWADSRDWDALAKLLTQ